jgi:autotransporter-associated beta strand protein
MFVKNEQGLFVYKAQGGPDATGPYDTTEMPRMSPPGYIFEGPTGIKIGDTWFVYGDRYGENRMGLLTSDASMTTWTEHVNDLIFPERGKHGTVIKVPRSVAVNLLNNAPNPTTEIEFDGFGGTSGYLTGANWLSGSVPNPSQTAVIQNGLSANLVNSTTTAGKLFVGLTSPGSFNVSGATTLNVNGEVRVGRANSIGAVGTMRVTSGNVNITDSVQIGHGAVHLDGGVVTTSSVHGSGAAALYLNGGTLRASANSTAFISNVTTLAIQSGGAVVDTNGFNVTVAQPFTSAPGGGGLTKTGAGVLNLASTHTYSGPTTIAQGTLKLGVPAPPVAHRWSFDGNLTDSAGSSNATIVNVGTLNTTLSATDVTLNGGTRSQADYVRLGSNLLPNSNTPVTIELWATPRSVQNWSRIFDLGASSGETLFMSWTQGTNANSDRVEWKDGVTTTSDNTNRPYALDTEYHIVMVLDPLGSSTAVTWYSAPSGTANLGAAKGSFTTSNTLANLTDSADNLGRSFYSADATANATYNEVRFWDGALSASILEVLHDVGPTADITSLNLSTPGALPTNTAVNITAVGATLDLNNLNQTIGSLSGVPGSAVVLGTGVLTSGGNNTSTTYAGDISGAGGLVKTGTATFTLSGGNTFSGGVTVNGGALVVNRFRNGALAVNAGLARVTPGTAPNDPNSTSIVPSLAIAAGAALDLTTNSMIIDTASPAGPLVNTVREHLESGRLASSSANPSTALGYADNAVTGLAIFSGVSVDQTSILIKFTWLGDTDLDGDVDIADLGDLASSWQGTGVWTDGDFDYNGTVNVNDLGLLASNWQAGVGNPLGPSLDEALAGFGLPSLNVPEPAGLGWLLPLALKCRRPRRGAPSRL